MSSFLHDTPPAEPVPSARSPRAAAPAPPLVEAAIVSFNTREILRTAIESLQAHQPPDHVAHLRISVLDNGSSDGSAEMVGTEFADVNLIQSPRNLGFGEANNTIARQSEADYLLFLNSDVVVTQDLVAPLVAALARDPKAIVASPRLIWPDGRVQLSAQTFPDLACEFGLILRGTRLGRAIAAIFDSEAHVREMRQPTLAAGRAEESRPKFIWATCWMMRTQDARDAGPFSRAFPMYDEDLDFCRRAHQGGRTLAYLPEVELVHLGGASSTSDAKARLMATARGTYYRTHEGRCTEYAYRVGGEFVSRLVRLVAAVPRPQERTSGGHGD
jgi:GT2 family glycosyltransferase